VAVTNDDEIKANFREEPMTEADLIRKLTNKKLKKERKCLRLLRRSGGSKDCPRV